MYNWKLFFSSKSENTDAVLLDVSESSSGPEFSSISPHLINIKDKTISSSKVDKNFKPLTYQ